MRNHLLGALLAGAASLTVASPALAQSEDTPFSGVYVGGSIGYDIQDNDIGSRILFDRNLDGSFNDTVTTAAGGNAFSPGFCNGAATSTANNRCENDKDDISYSARVGFDKQFGAAVFGVVGEFGKTEVRDSVSGFSTTPASYTLTREVGWEGSLRARAGFAANTTLFYATGGAGYARINHDFSTSNTANAFSDSGKRDQLGLLVGGGLEQKIGQNFSFGLEYMFHQYDDDDYTVRASQGSAAATNPFILAPNTTGTDLQRSDEKFRWHSMKVTAAFRF